MVIGFPGRNAASEAFELDNGNIGVGRGVNGRLTHAVEGYHVTKAFKVTRDSSLSNQPGRKAWRRIRKFHHPIFSHHVEKGGSIGSETITQCLSKHR